MPQDVAPAKLILELEDGSRYIGTSFAADTAALGEVVFNTAMAGYVEALTDPSYSGQILVMTYPLMGNYGVPAPRNPGSLDGPFESRRIQASGLVVQSYCEFPSHHSSTRSLGQWLATEGIPGLTGIDTRALTLRLREHGTMSGVIYPESVSSDAAWKSAARVEMTREVFLDVAPPEVVIYEGGETRIALIDCGAKDQLVRSLQSRGATVLRIPWHVNLAAHIGSVSGILIGNGPGDPANLDQLSSAVGSLLDDFAGPVFGVCLGHQILAKAVGAETYKLPYGHRGINHPVQDVMTRRAYVTSQNHGYAVDARTLPAGWQTSMINLNDGTNEGIRATAKAHWSVQFHPEGSPGPDDTSFLFDEFLRCAASARRGA